MCVSGVWRACIRLCVCAHVLGVEYVCICVMFVCACLGCGVCVCDVCVCVHVLGVDSVCV